MEIRNFYKEAKLFIRFLWILLIIDHTHAYKYLGVLHFRSKSHFIVGSALMRGLAEKGHQVTVISAFSLKKTLRNYQEIPLHSVTKLVEDVREKFFENTNVFSIHNSHNLGLQVTEAVLNEPSVKALMATNQTFDAVIYEVFMSEALYGISEHFKAPLIGLGTFGALAWNTDMVSSPSPLSYVPHPFLPFTDRMSLKDRLINLAYTTYERLYLDFYYLPKQQEIYSKYFPHNKRSLYEVRKNAALVLLNTHVSLSFPRPYVPNQIEVGGMHINRKRTPLAQDIEKFISESPHGVVYFSMGSNMKSKNMPQEKIQEILKAFKALKQRVLWKFEDPNLQGKPDNVLIRDWFAQDDILAHENVKVFITHGGLLSTTESIYHGKPFIGIPIFGDQFLNMAKAVANGYAIKLDYNNLKAEDLQQAVEAMVNKPNYTELVKEVSLLYRDQPMEPLELATYWVEYVARHKGAKHLHCAGLDLNFIQYHSIDTILILVGATICGLSVIVWLLRCALKWLFANILYKDKIKLKNH